MVHATILFRPIIRNRIRRALGGVLCFLQYLVVYSRTGLQKKQVSRRRAHLLFERQFLNSETRGTAGMMDKFKSARQEVINLHDSLN